MEVLDREALDWRADVAPVPLRFLEDETWKARARASIAPRYRYLQAYLVAIDQRTAGERRRTERHASLWPACGHGSRRAECAAGIVREFLTARLRQQETAWAQQAAYRR